MSTPQVNFYVFKDIPYHIARGLNNKFSDMVPLQRDLLSELTKPCADIKRGEFMVINFNYLDKTIAGLYRDIGTSIPWNQMRSWIFTKCIEEYLWSLLNEENTPKINLLLKHEVARLGAVIQDESLKARYILLGTKFHDIKPKRWQ